LEIVKQGQIYVLGGCHEYVNRFLKKLEEAHIWYSIDKPLPDSIQVLVVVPGERWEIDFFFDDGVECSNIWVEKFKSDGTIFDRDEIEILFKDFSD